MSLLLNNFNKVMSKSKDFGAKETAKFDVMYSTGFLAIDYLNGTVVHVKGNDRDFSYNSCGTGWSHGNPNSWCLIPNSISHFFRDFLFTADEKS